MVSASVLLVVGGVSVPVLRLLLGTSRLTIGELLLSLTVGAITWSVVIASRRLPSRTDANPAHVSDVPKDPR